MGQNKRIMNLKEAIKIIALVMLYQLVKENKLDFKKLQERMEKPDETFKEVLRQLTEQTEANINYWKQIKEWRNKNNDR